MVRALANRTKALENGRNVAFCAFRRAMAAPTPTTGYSWRFRVCACVCSRQLSSLRQRWQLSVSAVSSELVPMNVGCSNSPKKLLGIGLRRRGRSIHPFRWWYNFGTRSTSEPETGILVGRRSWSSLVRSCISLFVLQHGSEKALREADEARLYRRSTSPFWYS